MEFRIPVHDFNLTVHTLKDSIRVPRFKAAKMPFSHHSHSGEFCAHATGTLEEMVRTAIAREMRVYALTEHMPRDIEDFYPEEVSLHVP